MGTWHTGQSTQHASAAAAVAFQSLREKYVLPWNSALSLFPVDTWFGAIVHRTVQCVWDTPYQVRDVGDGGRPRGHRCTQRRRTKHVGTGAVIVAVVVVVHHVGHLELEGQQAVEMSSARNVGVTTREANGVGTGQDRNARDRAGNWCQAPTCRFAIFRTSCATAS